MKRQPLTCRLGNRERHRLAPLARREDFSKVGCDREATARMPAGGTISIDPDRITERAVVITHVLEEILAHTGDGPRRDTKE